MNSTGAGYSTNGFQASSVTKTVTLANSAFVIAGERSLTHPASMTNGRRLALAECH